MSDTLAIANRPSPAVSTGSAWLWQAIKALPYVWQSGTWLIGYVLLRFFGRFTVSGVDNIPYTRKGGLILAANHSSDLDGVMLLAAFPPFSRHFPLYYVAKSRGDYAWDDSLRKLIYRAWFFWLIGAFPVVTKARDYALSLALHERLLHDGHTVAIFPEGSYRKKTNELKARGGVVYLAEQTNCPVIPVHITGVEDMTILSFLMRKHTLHVHYGVPQQSAELLGNEEGPDRYKHAALTLMRHIYSL
ncbi:MAG: 1-acyl-sn-glycerol-3-phosphate acyltransferase [Candidatus Pacebacteria bacterium]|nr:1-acyl-sn-glycerol-3-phosphate acyltransferase [Candidatus Paceibacterota bacterium]